jgi:hypothetical protein
MGEAINAPTSNMSEPDLKAIATYLTDASGSPNPILPAGPSLLVVGFIVTFARVAMGSTARTFPSSCPP